MTLSEAIERLKVEKSYAEYALMHNPNDERYRSLADAIDTVRNWTNDFIGCISQFSNFKIEDDKKEPEKTDTLCCACGETFIPPCENSTLPDADELPFG